MDFFRYKKVTLNCKLILWGDFLVCLEIPMTRTSYEFFQGLDDSTIS